MWSDRHMPTFRNNELLPSGSLSIVVAGSFVASVHYLRNVSVVTYQQRMQSRNNNEPYTFHLYFAQSVVQIWRIEIVLTLSASSSCCGYWHCPRQLTWSLRARGWRGKMVRGEAQRAHLQPFPVRFKNIIANDCAASFKQSGEVNCQKF